MNAPDVVYLVSDAGLGVAEADFAVRELRRSVGRDVPLLMGSAGAEPLAHARFPDDARVLVLASPWLTLEGRCLVRLQAALQAGWDTALACDSRHPGPMGSPPYMTLRGMERFVDRAPQELLPQPAHQGASVMLMNVATWKRRLASVASAAPGEAAGRTVLVGGAWAHDADGYFSFARDELLPLLPVTSSRVLDVGGAGGGFLSALKQARPGTRTHLVELTAEAVDLARAGTGVDEIWQGDFLAYDTALRFDCISFLDVLEHMPDPEAALQQARRLLSPEGVVLASIPNVGHWSVVADLLEGRWDWASVGIHCITHLRFFTRRTIEDMFQRCGFEVQAWQPVLVAGHEAQLGALQGSPLALDPGSLDTYAYLLRARPFRAAMPGNAG